MRALPQDPHGEKKMAKEFHVTCTLPNASDLINGVKFAPHESRDGAVRTVDPVSEAVADHFSQIRGYHVEPVEVVKTETKAEKKAREAAERKAAEEAKAAEEDAARKAAEAEDAKNAESKSDESKTEDKPEEGKLV